MYTHPGLRKRHIDLGVKRYAKELLRCIANALTTVKVAEGLRPSRVQIRKVIVVDQSINIDQRPCSNVASTKASMDSSSAVFPMDSSSAVAPVDAQRPRRRLPRVQFRILIIGRANAGKTSILQRVCETTKSPVIYRGKKKEERVRSPKVMFASLISLPTRLNLSRLWMSVSIVLLFRLPLNNELARRAHHRRRACVFQSRRLRFSRLPRNRVR